MKLKIYKEIFLENYVEKKSNFIDFFLISIYTDNRKFLKRN